MISRMQQGNLPDVVALAQSSSVFHPETGTRKFYTLEMLARWIFSDYGVFLVSLEGGSLTGFIIAVYNPHAREARIYCLVLKEGSVVGRDLLRETMVEFHRVGCERVFALVEESDTEMQRILRENAFEIIEVRYMERTF